MSDNAPERMTTLRSALMTSAYPSGWDVDSLTKPVAYTYQTFVRGEGAEAGEWKRSVSIRQEKLFQPEQR